MYVSEAPGYIITSADYGSTWTKITSIPQTTNGAGYWSNIACNPTGQHVAAYYQSIYTDGADPRLYVSSDYGSTWALSWNPAVASSNARIMYLGPSGQRMSLSAYKGGIYTSSDYGHSWSLTSAPSPMYYAWMSSSSDGRVIAAIDNRAFTTVTLGGGGIWASSDSGSTWANLA
jgi:photosystem II stability/assembly factor-like uncharacterized protein